MNRRSFLHRLGITAAVAGAGTTSTVAVAARKPTREQLERYYTLLWREHHELSKELGIDMHDSSVAHRNGNFDATEMQGPPSSRALAVLTVAGVA